MDWITTSGGSLDEAKSHALDQLGIVADEAEFDIVNDVEKNFFGRVKTEAKVRARVRPKQPAVDERSNGGGRRKGRSRSRNGGGNNNGGNSNGKTNNRSGSGNGGNAKQKSDNNKSGDQQRNSRGQQKSGKGGNGGNNRNGGGNKQSKRNSGGNTGQEKVSNSGNAASGAAAAAAATTNTKRDTVEHELMSRDDQEAAAQSFLEGVLESFGMEGAVAVSEDVADDDAIEMLVTGNELGLLVGPKGATLNAVQELTRTVVQRNADGAKTNRLRVDVAGYRARRNAALQDFARKIAADVVDSGTEKLLEPMGPADRKVVHDTVNDIDGVVTGSEGEEPRRRVVIRPA